MQTLSFEGQSLGQPCCGAGNPEKAADIGEHGAIKLTFAGNYNMYDMVGQGQIEVRRKENQKKCSQCDQPRTMDCSIQ